MLKSLSTGTGNLCVARLLQSVEKNDVQGRPAISGGPELI